MNFQRYYLQRATPLSFLPFAFTGKRQMGAYLQSGKAGWGEEWSCALTWITSGSGRSVLIIRDQHLEMTLHAYKFKLIRQQLVFQTTGTGVNFSLRNKSHPCFGMPCFLTYVIVFLWEDRERLFQTSPALTAFAFFLFQKSRPR